MTIIDQFFVLFALLITVGILTLLVRERSVRARKIMQGIGGLLLIGGGIWILLPKIDATSATQATEIIAAPAQTAVFLEFYSDY